MLESNSPRDEIPEPGNESPWVGPDPIRKYPPCGVSSSMNGSIEKEGTEEKGHWPGRDQDGGENYRDYGEYFHWEALMDRALTINVKELTIQEEKVMAVLRKETIPLG
jgi:hypothetical protein